MSTTATTTTTTTTTTAKKKFGKNLNKLTKPPAPPAASESSKANAASRNGLLLLSANKRNSGSGPSNGLLASKPSVATPLPSLGLQYESTTSTHDVLLGAVVGAAASRAEQTPDAWGVAAAANNQNNNNSQNILNGSYIEPKSEVKPATTTTEKAAPLSKRPEETSRATTPPGEESVRASSSNWDEYGGREAASSGGRGLVSTDRAATVVLAGGNNSNSSLYQDDPNVDSQQAYMAKLARERAERRRQEEAARARDQKEKATQRLRALESKMEGNANNSNSRKTVVLEPLGGNVSAPTNASTPVMAARPTQRTLYDPNRTYSSLVGGGAHGGHEGKNNGNASGGGSIGSRDDQHQQERGNGDLSPKPNTTPGAYSGPVIHLSSYDDRDRGEAPRPAAPRMLFDPKSGSMVAVPSRDDNPRSGKNSSSKGRSRNRGNKQADEDTPNTRGNKQAKVKNGKKGGAKAAGKNTAKSSKNTIVSDRKLPRTRGVLFARDDKGNCYCADGCDGDLGYGAHSVHGGRIRNPDAYSKFMEQQQQLYKEQVPPVARQQQRSLSADRFDGYEYDNHVGHNSYGEDIGAGLHTGFSMSANSLASEPEETQPPVQLDWVKPNEKIELVTGVDDESPTLQARARAFVPSEAALAAAAQAAALPSLGSHDMEDEISERTTTLEPRTTSVLSNVNLSDDEDDDEVIHPSLGLGFDPTENMDYVIQSPSAKIDTTSATKKQLDAVDFGALSLEAPLCGVAANNHNHIFAFGSSATWGTGGDSNDWGAAISSNAGAISASRLFGGVLGASTVTTDNIGNASLGEDHEDDAFLSLTTGIPGLLAGGAEDGSISGEHMVGGD